jgi:dihydroflavonol-4-reductase
MSERRARTRRTAPAQPEPPVSEPAAPEPAAPRPSATKTASGKTAPPKTAGTKTTAPKAATRTAAPPKPAAPKTSTARPKALPRLVAAEGEPKPRRSRAKAAVPAATVTAAAQPFPASGSRTIWMSGASGFVGRQVARVLRMRGDAVIAPVRDVRRAADLVDMGVTVLEDDLQDVDRLAETMRGADAVIHAAGSYRVGIGREERGPMWDANIGTTTRVLDAAEAARIPRIVYVSTVSVFGNTKGQVVDEAYRRNIREGFLGWYDETKFGAHEVALQRSRAGAPIVFVLPSQVYGPDDHSAIGEQLAMAFGGRLPYRALEGVGLGWVHVDDLAVGIAAALDRGAPNRAYVLSGPRHRLGEALAIAAGLGKHPLPRLGLPDALLRLLAPAGKAIGQPNLREVVSSSAGVTYWASSERAGRELDWHPRSLEDGLRDTFEALADRAYTRS